MDLLHQKQVGHVDAELTLGPSSASNLVRPSLSSFPLSQNNSMENAHPWQGGLVFSSEADRKRKREWNNPKHATGNNDSAVGTSAKLNDPWVELRPQAPLPPGWEQCLDLQSGEMYYVNWSTQMKTCHDPRKEVQPSSSAAPGMWKSQHAFETSFKENLFQRSAYQPPPRPGNENPGRALMGSSLAGRSAHGLDLEMSLPSSGRSYVRTGDPVKAGELRDFWGLNTKDATEPVPAFSNGAVSMEDNNGSNNESSMVAIVCLQCHMFVMLSKASPHCPNCRTVCAIDQCQPLSGERNPQTLKLLDSTGKLLMPKTEGY